MRGCTGRLLPVTAAFISLPFRCALQEVMSKLNCTTGFSAAALQQRLKDEWGAAPWLTCNNM